MMVIGLDCAPPHFVFERFADDMPNITRLRREGAWGKLRSCYPPITVPAWTVMMSGRSAGELGLYGFRNRVPGSYDMHVATSKDVKVKRVWDRLAEAGKRVAVLFVPLTSPPSPVRGEMISCFLTPDLDRPYTFPRSLAAEIEERFGPYMMDVPDFRAGDAERVLEAIDTMTDQHFAIAKHVWKTKEPDFMMMVEMGPDRLHHALYQHIDPAHPAYDPEGPFADAGRRYYAKLDRLVGELIAEADDDTAIMIVSDHGARPMLGGVAINEWLIDQGWLTLKGEQPREHTALSKQEIDWSRTKAWALGGYYSRVMLNVKGRDPNGVIEAREVPKALEDLKALLARIPKQDGGVFEVEAKAPTELYDEVRGFPPDLLVFFEGLAYRALGTIGPESQSYERSRDDRGEDTCNHDWNGIFVCKGGEAGEREGLQIEDVAKTVLGLMDVSPPRGMGGSDRSNE